MDMPDIPSTDDPAIREALLALVNSAAVMRRALLLVTAAGADPKRVMRDHGELLVTAEQVITEWCAHMGIDPD